MAAPGNAARHTFSNCGRKWPMARSVNHFAGSAKLPNREAGDIRNSSNGRRYQVLDRWMTLQLRVISLGGKARDDDHSEIARVLFLARRASLRTGAQARPRARPDEYCLARAGA